jgi:catechol 2,3-dioxygenase-like lactoylglutathione lyase family enzyme
MLHLAALVLAGAAAAAEAPLVAESPTFVALSVRDLDASVKWYTETLGLTATRLPPHGISKAAIVRGPGLLVELVQHGESFPLESRLPGLKGRYIVQGIFKVGVFVDDLDATVKRLTDKGARFKGRLFSDETTGVRSHLLLDNEDNVIQLFEELKAPAAKP